MNKKRFTMDYEPTYRDTMYLDYDKVMTKNEVLNTLNELYNENEQLKKENKKLQSINNQLETRLETSGIGIALKMEDFE